eukprot:11192246-Lingulodinium_polyedra.AAC.1
MPGPTRACAGRPGACACWRPWPCAVGSLRQPPALLATERACRDLARPLACCRACASHLVGCHGYGL